MKIFFEKTNGNNNIIFTDGEKAKVCDFAPSGKMDGIDLYADDAGKQLKKYFQNTEINDFYGMPGDEIAVAEIADEIEELSELVFDDETHE